jgi:DNA-binding transcriptional LysR family regulator
MDRVEAMSALLEVVKSGSFSAAARDLGVPTTSLTRKITDLEARLGAKLLNRTTRSLSLTDVGKAYVVAARRIVDDVEEAERAVAAEYDEPRGELVLTAPTMFGRLHVLPVVASFLEAFPKVSVRLFLTDINLHLVDDRIDVAVRLGELADSSLIARRVGEMRIVVCGSPAFFEKHGIPRSPKDVETVPTVAVGGHNQRRPWKFADLTLTENSTVAIKPRLYVTTNEAAVDAAILGVGLTQQRFYQVADKIASGSLVMCLREFETHPIPVHILHASRDFIPLKTRKFLDFATPLLRARLAALDGNA